MKEGAERSREHPDRTDRVRLEHDVEHARRVEIGFGSCDDTVVS